MAIALANPATMVHPHYSSITLPLQTISHFWLQHLVKYNLWYPVYRSAHHFSQLRSIQKSPKLHPVLKAPKFHRHFGSLKEAMTTSPSWPKKLHALQGKSSSCASNWGLLQGHVMTCDTIGNPIPLMLNTPRNHGPQYVEFLHETMVSWDKFTYDIICDHMVYCMRNRRNRPATTGGCYISWCPSCSKCEKMAASRWMIWPLGSSRRISQKLWRFLKVWQFWLCYIYIYLVIYFSHCKSHCCFFFWDSHCTISKVGAGCCLGNAAGEDMPEGCGVNDVAPNKREIREVNVQWHVIYI